MRGVTTVRDLGGPVFGLKRAIEKGLVREPRVYPSDALISQTIGHADFRFQNQPLVLFGGVRSELELGGYARVADGVPLVLAAAREKQAQSLRQ